MRKRTEEEVREVVENFGYRLLNESMYKNRKRVVIQDSDGYKYETLLENLLKGQKPNFVGINNPFSLENISLWLNISNSQFKLLENNDYTESCSKLNLYCNICKDYPKMSWDHILEGIACGVCRGLQVGKYHNLAIQRPDIAKEWHPTLNGDLTPRDVTCGSHKKIWWLCLNGHEYCSRIYSRKDGRGCPFCSSEQKESKVASELKKYIFNKYEFQEEYRILKNPKTRHWLPYDIYIFTGRDKKINGVYIEIHGIHHYVIHDWHKRQAKKNETTPEEEFEYQKHKDRLKRRFARKNGIYIEVDLRKIKTAEQAIEYFENIMEKTLS